MEPKVKWGIAGFVLGLVLVSVVYYVFFAIEPYPLPADMRILEPASLDPGTPSETPRYSLQEAVSQNLVDYKITGTGSSSGGSLIVALQNKAGFPIDVYILPGTILAPTGGEVQRMMAWRALAVVTEDNNQPVNVTSFYLPDAGVRFGMVEAYCLDFELPNPQVTSNFAVAAEVDMVTASVVYAAKQENMSVAATQVAVWKNRDDHITQQEISGKFEASKEDFDKAFELVRRVRKARGSQGA